MCECSVVQWNGVGWGGVGWGGSGIGRFMRETKQAMVWVCKCSLRIGGEREEKRRTLCRVFYIAHIGQGKNCHVFIEFFFPFFFFFFPFSFIIVRPKYRESQHHKVITLYLCTSLFYF